MNSIKKLGLILVIAFMLIGNTIIFTVTSQQQGEQEKWVILISGGMSDNTTDNWFTNTTLHAYNTFKNLGYDDDHIYYIDDRNEMMEGVDALVNKTTVEYAMVNWLKINADAHDQVCIYFNGHGGFDIIGPPLFVEIIVVTDKNKEDEMIRSSEFSSWIDQITCETLTVVLDTCFAGNFINELSKENRIIITSSSKYWVSMADDEYEAIFSYHFLDKLYDGGSYGDAWEYADKNMFNCNFPYLQDYSLFDRLMAMVAYKIQNPQIDDNGDGIGHGNNFEIDTLPFQGDGNLAIETYP